MEKAPINNEFYEGLHEKWYQDDGHAIALLKAENRTRGPWVADQIADRFADKKLSILDMGCGAGFLSNLLSLKGHKVTGVDLSASSLEEARKRDTTQTVSYRQANACERLPFSDESFDVVCALDVLEHVHYPQKLLDEASRVLKRQGLFFFHTFNRNWLSYLMIVKGVEWIMRETPPNLHAYKLFIKPKELKSFLEKRGLFTEMITGFAPQFFSLAFLKMLITGSVPQDLLFVFTRNLFTGYCGIARKKGVDG